MKNYILIFSCFLLLINCERINELELELPFEGEEFSVYAFLTESDSSYTAIFKNKPVLEEFSGVETMNAKFNIKSINSEVECIELKDNSELLSRLSLNTKESYSVEANLDLESYQSNLISIPPKVYIDSIDVIPFANRDDINLDIHFTDHPEVDFYSISILIFYEGEVLEDRLNIPELKDVFDDTQSFNSIITKEFSEFDISPFLSVIPPLVADSINVNLYSLSREFYEFSQALNAENETLSSISDQETFFFSNIEGARGFAGGFNKTSFGIKLSN